MVLDGEDDGVLGGDEGVLLDALHHVPELDLGGHRVPVVDEGIPVLSVPAV